MKNLNVLENIPTTALKEVTVNENSNGSGIVREADFLATGDHTKAETQIPNLNATTGSPMAQTPQAGGVMPQNNGGAKLGSVIGGKTGADLIDVLFPSLCVWVVSMIGYNIPKGRLQMTAKEKEVLAPALQNYLDSINVNFNNPLYNLLFVFGSIYAAKTVDLFSNNEIKPISKTELKKNKVVEKVLPKEMTGEQLLKEIAKIRRKGLIDAKNFFDEYETRIREGEDLEETVKELNKLNYETKTKRPRK